MKCDFKSCKLSLESSLRLVIGTCPADGAVSVISVASTHVCRTMGPAARSVGRRPPKQRLITRSSYAAQL